MATLARTFATESQFTNDAFQQRLARWNRKRLAPTFPSEGWSRELDTDLVMLRLEGGFIEELRGEVLREAAVAPTDPDGFIACFEALKHGGPGQGDPLFPWIAKRANRTELSWFLQQEAAGEAGFDDLTALTQVQLPAQAKLELARNYWDEMGRGNALAIGGIHCA